MSAGAMRALRTKKKDLLRSCSRPRDDLPEKEDADDVSFFGDKRRTSRERYGRPPELGNWKYSAVNNDNDTGRDQHELIAGNDSDKGAPS